MCSIVYLICICHISYFVYLFDLIKFSIFFMYTLLIELLDISEEEENSVVDIFAIGFEEIVDLNASNIVSAR